MKHHLNLSMDPTRLCLRPPAWPAMDQAAWVVANEPGDVFDPGGAGARWAPATRRGIMQSYGRWLTWLTCTRPGDLDLPFVDRLKPVPIAAYIADLQCVNASCTVWTRVALLADAIQAMAPETDLIWMRKVIVRLHRLVEPVRLKRHRLVESAALFTLGMDTMADAESAAVPAWRRAQRYLDGLMIALLALRPLRLGNFTGIEIDRHLLRRGDGYQLRFAASETKPRRRLEFPVPVALVGCLERYMAIYRPILCLRFRRGSPASMRLWVSSAGTALHRNTIYDRIVRLTRTRFGQPINPHLFRDCAATSIAEHDPEHVLITKEILGHSTMRASERYYNHARSHQAITAYQEHVLTMRPRPRKLRDRTDRINR